MTFSEPSRPPCGAPSSSPRPPASRSAPTRGSAACCSPPTARGRRGLPPRRRQPARRGRALAEAGERGARHHRRRHPRAVQPHRPHRSVRQALVGAGVRRVVFAQPDTNPVAAGGAATLRAAGIEVEGGLLADEARRSTGRGPSPSSTAARSSPGSSPPPSTAAAPRPTAPPAGSPRAAARLDTHRLRALCDAILVGTSTVEVDDPQLTVRDEHDQPLPRQLLRVVMGERDLAPGRRVFDDRAETVHLRTRDPHDALAELFARDRQHVFLEGGPTLAAAFLRGRPRRRGRRVRRADAARLRPVAPSATWASAPSPTRCTCSSTDVTVLAGRRRRHQRADRP